MYALQKVYVASWRHRVHVEPGAFFVCGHMYSVCTNGNQMFTAVGGSAGAAGIATPTPTRKVRAAVIATKVLATLDTFLQHASIASWPHRVHLQANASFLRCHIYRVLYDCNLQRTQFCSSV